MVVYCINLAKRPRVSVQGLSLAQETMYYDDANDVDYEDDDQHAFITTDEHGQSVGPMGITTKIPPSFDGRALRGSPTRS